MSGGYYRQMVGIPSGVTEATIWAVVFATVLARDMEVGAERRSGHVADRAWAMAQAALDAYRDRKAHAAREKR